MTDEEARQVLAEQFHVPRETLDRLSAFIDLVRAENDRQNLVSRGTFDTFWTRHILDSAQLLRFAPKNAKSWLDLGTGAGFPGLIVAALHSAQVTMVESRKLRVDFLRRSADLLQLPASTRIVCSRVERLEEERFDVISARALAPLDRLFDLAIRFAAPKTRWVLPKGRKTHAELEAARRSWQGMFHVEPSLTDPEAGIIVAEQVVKLRRGKGAR
jgi:16S rRNA (guanine527-N7)-methyltransferase